MMHRYTIITGGIGSGKSVVSRVLRLRGRHVFDCDAEARRLLDSDPEVRSEVTALLGDEAYRPDGLPDRPLIARKVFADKALLAGLNAIIHARVKWLIEQRIYEISPRRLYVETAIPVTAHLTDDADRILLVAAPKSLRIERACRRDACMPEQIEARMEAQRAEYDTLPPDKTVVIENDAHTSLLSLLAEY